MSKPDDMNSIAAIAGRALAGEAFRTPPKLPRMLLFADYYYERIELEIKEYEKSLREDQELIIEVPLIDGTRVFATWFGYRNPNMIIVEGLDAKNNHVRVLIPHTDIHIIMTRRDAPAKQKKNKIGFQPITSDDDA